MHHVVRRLWRGWCSDRHIVAAAASETGHEDLARIFDANKRDPGLVNHNLYALLLEEDTLRLAHRRVVGDAERFYERRTLVREIMTELADEKFQFGESQSDPPPFRDKVLLEAMRAVLESVYEPVFLDWSHGFRPARSRHTALRAVRRGLRDHRYALVGRLATPNVDPHLLTSLLQQKIGDKRFMRLTWKALKAGHGERRPHVWTVKNAWDGRRDAATLSTLLSNVYLHRLDTWVRDRKQRFDRAMGPCVTNFTHRIARLERDGKLARANLLSTRKAQLVKRSRELFYVRYGDEFMLSCIASKAETLDLKNELEGFLMQDLQLEGLDVIRFGRSHAFFLGTKIKLGSRGAVRLEAPMDRIVGELAKLGMVSVGGTRPHPVTYLARCSHNEIVSYYNWVMRGCCTYYSFVDNFYQLTSFLRLALRSSCVRTLTMKLKRFRSARTYKEFGAECAARFRVPLLHGSVLDDELSDEVKSLLKSRISAAKKLRLEWASLGAIEKGLLERFVIPKRREEANGDVYLEFRGDFLIYCGKDTEHEETKRALRKLELLPSAQNIWDFKEALTPPPRPALSVDYEPLYPR